MSKQLITNEKNSIDVLTLRAWLRVSHCFHKLISFYFSFWEPWGKQFIILTLYYKHCMHLPSTNKFYCFSMTALSLKHTLHSNSGLPKRPLPKGHRPKKPQTKRPPIHRPLTQKATFPRILSQ